MDPTGPLAFQSSQIGRFPSCRIRVSATRREGRPGETWFPMVSHGFPLLLFWYQILLDDLMTGCKIVLLYYTALYTHPFSMMTDTCMPLEYPWIISLAFLACLRVHRQHHSKMLHRRGVPCCCAFSCAELWSPGCCSTTSCAAGAVERSLCCSWTTLDELGRLRRFEWERKRPWKTYRYI